MVPIDSPLFSAAEVVVLFLVVVAVFLGAVAVRRRVIQRRFFAFQTSVRSPRDPPGRGWTLGIGCYDGDLLRWYRLFSFRMGARLVLDRRTMQVTGSRCPTGTEARSLLAGHVVLQVSDTGVDVELGVGEATRTHLTAWLETAERSGRQSLTPPRAGQVPGQGEARPVGGPSGPRQPSGLLRSTGGHR